MANSSSQLSVAKTDNTDTGGDSRSTGQEMPEGELLSLIRQYELASLGSQVAAGATISTTVYPSNQTMTTLEIDRYNALNAYFARPLGNEVENRSQVVLPELRDTIEWIMPQLMRMFVAAKTVCRFEPENQNDEEQAKLETLVINQIFMQQNNGFFVLHDYFKDAMLMRNGYAKIYWEEKEEATVERYRGLTEIEVASVLQDTADETLEILEQREYQRDVILPLPPLNPLAPQPPMGPVVVPMTVFDIKIRRTAKKGRICVQCIPPEEMRITPRARLGMEDLAFAMHITNRARSDLISDGYDEDWVNSLSAGRPNWLDIDALARNQMVDQLSIENPSDRAMQEIELREVIMRVDFDGDGVAELRRIIVGGDKIAPGEEGNCIIDETPFASCVPKRMPHRHTGISLYDEIMDLQIIKTTLWRQGLDNLTISNNQRVAVDWRNCNFDDLLTSRPGGVVRGSGPPQGWIMPLEQPSNLVAQVLPALAYMDTLKTNRTGIGPGTVAIDPDDLQNVTKGAQLAAMSAAALKVEMLARLLAEGVKDIFCKIHSEFIKNQDKPLEFEIAGKWVNVDPTSWRRRTKVTVNVGLGSGNREEMRTNVQMLGQAQMPLGQLGLVGPKQAYETFKVMCEALGFQSPERFAMDPASPEYQQHMAQMAAQPHPPDPMVQVAQIKAQSEQAALTSKQQIEQLRLRQERESTQGKLQVDREKAQAEIEHAALATHSDRQMQDADRESQLVLKIISALSPIIAQQLKMSQENAGAVLAQDTQVAKKGIEQDLGPMLDTLTQTLQGLNKPRTLTMSDGRQLTIQ